MTMYNVSEVRNHDAYSIDGAALNSQVASQNLEQVEFMYNEGVPEFVVDQNIYYPAATNYGYYCTGFEPPGEWDEHNMIYGLEGPDVHYTGVQNENVPYVYYTHSYGYAQSAYNPYNPYIPGAMLGVDGSLVGVQQYYTLSPYQNPVSSPAHVPVVQSDITPNNSLSYFFDDLSVNKPDGRGSRHNCASGSNPFGRHPSKAVASHLLPKMLEGPSPNAGVMQSSINGGVSANGFLSAASSNVFKDAESKVRSKVHMEKAMVSVKGSSGTLFELNRGPRTNRSKNQLLVRSYGANMGGASEQENIVIYADQYNGDDFLIEYKNAKFFVIKSYSEDDVHKSIKYNVWSSTLHGNKKLNNAYKDAQTIVGGESGGCPIFLFFSVNASGQFCGVAEMVGPVDYGKDMDFWQQDKWNGCFPVKWHIIKDVSNGSLRHIVLENNENKPVTNSRDTQEIMFKKGLEMLKVFKSHTLKTSILDDFMYYENRQKIILEEKTKLLGRSFERPVCAPKLDSRKLNFPSELPHRVEEKVSHNDPNSFKQLSTSTAEKVSSNCDVTDAKLKSENSENIVAYKDNQLSNLKIGSLTISSKEVETNLSPVTSAGLDNSELIDVLTVGSMSVKLNGFKKPFGNLTFGTIPFDPRPWQAANNGASSKNGS